MVSIGVDGGGTKTRAVAVAPDGRVVAQGEGEGMNYNAIPVGEAARRLADVLRGLMVAQEEIAAVAIGDPSVDDGVIHPQTEAFLAALRRELSGEMPVYVKSDAFMTLYALTQGKPGMLVIGGTGSMGVAMGADGGVYNAGGWGEPSYDPGSAYSTATQALRFLYQAADGHLPGCALLQDAAFEHFGVGDIRALSYRINALTGDRAAIAGFARAVASCAAAGSGAAMDMLMEAGDALADIARSLHRRIGGCPVGDLPIGNLPVGMYGSVLQKDTVVRERFIKRVREFLPEAAIGFPQKPPEYGAAMYALGQ